jgi:hypothetical protein
MLGWVSFGSVRRFNLPPDHASLKAEVGFLVIKSSASAIAIIGLMMRTKFRMLPAL